MKQMDAFRLLCNKSEHLSMCSQSFLDEMILLKRGYSCHRYPSRSCAYYNEPNEFQEVCWTSYMKQLVNDNNIYEISSLFEAGISNNPTNYFGKTMAHVVCRSGTSEMLKLMIEFGCDVRVVDGNGQSPLHYACCRDQPCFEIVELLLKEDDRLFHIIDNNQQTPLDCVPNDNWIQWNYFLKSIKDDIWPHRCDSLFGEQPPPPLTLMKPNERIHACPKTNITVQEATMIASGKLAFRKCNKKIDHDMATVTTQPDTESMSSGSSRRNLHLDNLDVASYRESITKLDCLSENTRIHRKRNGLLNRRVASERFIFNRSNEFIHEKSTKKMDQVLPATIQSLDHKSHPKFMSLSYDESNNDIHCIPLLVVENYDDDDDDFLSKMNIVAFGSIRRSELQSFERLSV